MSNKSFPNNSTSNCTKVKSCVYLPYMYNPFVLIIFLHNDWFGWKARERKKKAEKRMFTSIDRLRHYLPRRYLDLVIEHDSFQFKKNCLLKNDNNLVLYFISYFFPSSQHLTYFILCFLCFNLLFFVGLSMPNTEFVMPV